jgi:hypothetical protein
MYRFYLRRAFAGQSPDLLIMRERGRVVSGVGVNYRSLRLANGATIPAAILSAGWTSPARRGRGLFGRLMESAMVLAARRGCALALAFARGDNASARTLRRLGAHMLPTTYFSSDSGASPLPTTGMKPRVRSVPPATIQSAAAREAAGRAARFEYPRPEEWRLQFLERPCPVETLSIGGCMAIIERTAGTDRLQLLTGRPEERQAALETLVLRSRLADRRFLAFGLGEAAPERTGPPGMTTEPGHFALLVTAREKLAASLGIPAWQSAFAAGDLSSRCSPWYLGDWRIQPGDRM